jgi:CDP-glycerol glycerophosphotransferase (TagB/SpsB family)
MNLRLTHTPNRDLEDLLEQEKPDVIIHPCVLEGSYINDLVEAGFRGEIPTVVVMNSWDNPASKRSVVGTDYWLLVWGPQTRAHAEDIMGMPAERVVEFGAAQFDVYGDPPRINREGILYAHELSIEKPVLLYAGSSKSTDEFEHLRRIDDAITSGRLPEMSVIYRPHPWGDGGKEGHRFLEHGMRNVVVDNSMRDYLLRVAEGNKAKHLPDYRDTRDLLMAVDAVISPLSTLLIEAMLLGKAPMCFMPIEEQGAEHFQLSRNQVHFAELLNHPEIIVGWGGENLLDGVAEIMKRCSNLQYSDRLQQSAEFFIKSHDAPFRERILDFVDQIVGHR